MTVSGETSISNLEVRGFALLERRRLAPFTTGREPSLVETVAGSSPRQETPASGGGAAPRSSQNQRYGNDSDQRSSIPWLPSAAASPAGAREPVDRSEARAGAAAPRDHPRISHAECQWPGEGHPASCVPSSARERACRRASVTRESYPQRGSPKMMCSTMTNSLRSCRCS